MSTRTLTIAAVALLALGVTAPASAHSGAAPSAGYDYARVVDVRPLMRTVRVEQPRRECWLETHYEPVHPHPNAPIRTAGATIAGGVVGGAIGRQFGSGSGRDAATLFGTLVGAAVASERAYNRQVAERQHASYETRAVTVERCTVHTEYYTEERVEGYDVTYVYAGRQYRTRTDQHPGDRIRVHVSVQAAQR